MKRNTKLYQLVASALLCAIGIVIPMFSPVKLVIPPASFTLASHVPIFIAMFLAPGVAASVALITTVGFFLGGFPIVIVMRAATHLLFALVGALVLKSRPGLLDDRAKMLLFAFLISLLHAAAEVFVVIPFYFGNSMGEAYYTQGFFVSVILLVGVGSVVHSMVDFYIARIVWEPVKRSVR